MDGPSGSGTQAVERKVGGVFRERLTNIIWEYGTLIGLLVLVVFFSTMSDAFLRFGNIVNILRQISMLAIIATGLTFCMVTGDFDLGIGSIGSIAGVMTVSLLFGECPPSLACWQAWASQLCSAWQTQCS